MPENLPNVSSRRKLFETNDTQEHIPVLKVKIA